MALQFTSSCFRIDDGLQLKVDGDGGSWGFRINRNSYLLSQYSKSSTNQWKSFYKFSHPMVSCKKPNVSKHIWHEPTLMIVMLMKFIIQCFLLNKLTLFRTYQPQRKPNPKKSRNLETKDLLTTIPMTFRPMCWEAPRCSCSASSSSRSSGGKLALWPGRPGQDRPSEGPRTEDRDRGPRTHYDVII